MSVKSFSLSHTHAHTHTHICTCKDGMKWNTYWMGRLWWSDAERGKKEKRKTNIWTRQSETLERHNHSGRLKINNHMNWLNVNGMNWNWLLFKSSGPKRKEQRMSRRRNDELNVDVQANIRGCILIYLWLCTIHGQFPLCVISLILQLHAPAHSQSPFAKQLPLGMTSSFCCKNSISKVHLCMCKSVYMWVFSCTNKYSVSVCKCMHVDIVCEHTCVDRCQKCGTDWRACSQNQLLQSKTLNIPFYHHKWQISHLSASLQGTDFILMQFQCFLILALSAEGWRVKAWKELKIHFSHFLSYSFSLQHVTSGIMWGALTSHNVVWLSILCLFWLLMANISSYKHFGHWWLHSTCS